MNPLDFLILMTLPPTYTLVFDVRPADVESVVIASA